MEKRKNEIKIISALWFSFTLYYIGAEKSVKKNLIGEKEKRTSIGNDKHKDADSLLHDTATHTQSLYKISKS